MSAPRVLFWLFLFLSSLHAQTTAPTLTRLFLNYYCPAGEQETDIYWNIYGTGFTAASALEVNSVPLITSQADATPATELNAGLFRSSNLTLWDTVRNGGATAVRVRTGANLTSAITFSGTAAPRITAVSPPSFPAAQTAPQMVTITGSNFTAQTRVLAWRGGTFCGVEPLPATFVSSTEMRVTLPLNLLNAGGRVLIHLENLLPTTSTTGGRNLSNTRVITIGPQITDIQPAPAVGTTPASVAVTGKGFAPGAQVRVSGAAVPTTYVSSTQLNAVFPASLYTTSTRTEVRVSDGATTSDAYFYVVFPRVDSMNPTSAAASGGLGVTVTLTGAGFVTGSRAYACLNGCTALTTNRLSDSQLTAVIPPSLLGTAQILRIYVFAPQPDSNNIGGSSFQQFGVGQSINCVSLSPSSATVSSLGGNNSFGVLATCGWTARSNAPFLTLTGGTQGSGNGTVSYSVQPYTAGTAARSGTIAVNDRVFTLTQNPPNASCTYTVNAARTSFDAAGGTSSVTVGTSTGCGWSAAASVPWIRITAGSNGSVSGTVTFTVDANSGAARTGVLTIAGQSITITQADGTSCPVTFEPASARFLASGSAAATFQVKTPCSWTAVSNQPWVRILGGASGSGPGTVTFAVDPNQTGQTRSAAITVRAKSFDIVQAVPECTFSLSTRTITLPPGGGGVPLTVTAPAGCTWTVDGTGFAGAAPGGGNGTATTIISAPSNPGTERTLNLSIRGQTLTIRQPGLQQFACTFNGPASVPTVRAGLQAELTGEPLLRCSGMAPQGGITADVVLTLNTNLTSKRIGPGLEALLLLNNPAAPLLGTSAFLGRLAGNNAVRFSNVPLALPGLNQERVLRFANLRADASLTDLGADITARVELFAPVPVGVNTPQLVVARRDAPLNLSFGNVGTGEGFLALPVTYQELLPGTFRTRSAENGYTHPALPAAVGSADTGFRLQVTVRSLPAGTRVQAPVIVQNGSTRADLTPQDRNGLGVGVLTGSFQELDVIQGEATATYEITSANNAVAESLSFNLLFSGISATALDALKTSFVAACGPTATGLPANGVLPVPRCGDPRAPAVTRRNIILKNAFVSTAASPRSPVARDLTGSRSISLRVTMSCDAGESCEEPVIRGNLSEGSSFFGACTVDGGSCSGEGRDVAIDYPRLGAGEQVTAVLAAELRDNAPLGSLVQFSASASTGISVGYDVVDSCFPGISSLPQPPGEGFSGTFIAYACGPWQITSSSPFITFDPASGTGNTEVRYTVLANNTGIGRSTNVTITGAPPILVNQPIPGGGGGGGGDGLRFVPVAPCRVMDTRAGEGKTGAFGPPTFAANQSRDIPVPQSTCGIPATARAYSVNMTVVPAGSLQFLTVWPTGQPRPLASTLNSFDGKIVANAALVPAGTNGAISIFVTGLTDVIMDINGYFAP